MKGKSLLLPQAEIESGLTAGENCNNYNIATTTACRINALGFFIVTAYDI